MIEVHILTLPISRTSMGLATASENVAERAGVRRKVSSFMVDGL